MLPIKGFPVLISTLCFSAVGSSIPSIFISRTPILVSTMIAIVFHVIAGFFLWYIIRRNKQGTPVLGLSNALWIITSLIGYGVGLGLSFAF